MAMTKAEKAEMDNLRAARDMARALRWPEYADPAKVPPPDFNGLNEGWLFNTHRADDARAYLGDAIYPAWSTSVSHGEGKRTPYGGSQRGVSLYATRLDALKGLRLALTEQYAGKLAMVDAEIAAEAARQSAALSPTEADQP